MSKYLKYILAICFAGMLGVAFLPIIEVSIYRLSVFDILKMTLNGSQSIEFLKELQKVMYQYVFKYLILFAIAVALILIASVLCIIQKDEHVYKRSIIYALIVNFYSSCVMLACYKSIETLDFSTNFFQTRPDISLYLITVFIWEMITLLIILISIMGIKMEKLKNVEIKEDIPELFQEDIHSFENQDIMEEDTPLELEIQEEYKQYSKIEEGQQYMEDNYQSDVFEGMILNTNQKVLVLKDRKEVYITNDNEINICRSQQGLVLGNIYYVSQYEEYCIQPLQTMTIFLTSGQPLGKNRFYYLPRGTEIYIKDQTNKFKLC